MDHYPFGTFNELLCSLNPVQLKEASASPENRLEFEERFCLKLKELKDQVIALHQESGSEQVSERYFYDYLENLSQCMQRLTGQLGPDATKEYFKKKHTSHFSSFIIVLLTCVNKEIRDLAECFGKYFNYNAPAPLLTGLEFYLERKEYLVWLIRKMKKRVDDAHLVQVIENFIHSFGVKNDGSPLLFSDCRCLERLGALIQSMLYRNRGNMGDSLRQALMTMGFNYPEFVMHCLCRLNKDLHAEAGHKEVLLQLHKLEPLFALLTGDQLQLSALQPVSVSCAEWRNNVKALWLSEERFESRVQEELLLRFEQLRISTSLSVRVLAMFARCLHEIGVITENDLEKLLCIWRRMFITVRNHNKKTAPGSFKKAFYGTDKKIAAILKGVFDQGINWLDLKTKLNDKEY